tara:strand:- start:27 stop:224 length:198 start_codon:yes stop_codon:yes gene_type:complete
LRLTINGTAREVPPVEMLPDLLKHLGIQGTVAVELNGRLVRRQDQASTSVTEGDCLEIVHFVGGG